MALHRAQRGQPISRAGKIESARVPAMTQAVHRCRASPSASSGQRSLCRNRQCKVNQARNPLERHLLRTTTLERHLFAPARAARSRGSDASVTCHRAHRDSARLGRTWQMASCPRQTRDLNQWHQRARWAGWGWVRRVCAHTGGGGALSTAPRF